MHGLREANSIMKFATKAKISGCVFLLLVVASCLLVPLYGNKHEFLGYHLIWMRPDFGALDENTLHIEWLLSLAISVSVFFGLEAVVAFLNFLRQKRLLLSATFVIVGSVLGWFLWDQSEAQLRRVQWSEATADSSAEQALSGVLRVRENRQREKVLLEISKRSAEIRLKLHSPKTWKAVRLSPLNAFANLQTQLSGPDRPPPSFVTELPPQSLSVIFWFSGNPEDIEEAIAHYGSISIKLLNAYHVPVVTIDTGGSSWAWSSKNGRRVYQYSGTTYCTEDVYVDCSSWQFE